MPHVTALLPVHEVLKYVLAGGLAAPAIAAGIGAAISLVGGASAAAAAASASGFLATAAGTAATAAGVGVAGGSFAGSRMARRVGARQLGSGHQAKVHVPVFDIMAGGWLARGCAAGQCVCRQMRTSWLLDGGRHIPCCMKCWGQCSIGSGEGTSIYMC